METEGFTITSTIDTINQMRWAFRLLLKKLEAQTFDSDVSLLTLHGSLLDMVKTVYRMLESRNLTQHITAMSDEEFRKLIEEVNQSEEN